MSRGLKLLIALSLIANFVLAVMYANTSAEYRIYKKFTDKSVIHVPEVPMENLR